MGIWYCTREDVKSALDSAETARNNVQVDRAIDAASRSVEALLRHRFYPEVGVRYADWPDGQYTRPWRLWLDDTNEVISLTSLTAGDVAIDPADYLLEPANSGPPYTRLEINRGSSAAFASSNTEQRAIVLSGVFGYSAFEDAGGALAEALDAVETSVDITDSSLIGVGSIIRVGSERMIVTGKQMLDTGQNLQANLAANKAEVTVAVTTGAAFAVGETILLDGERMLIVDIAGNNLVVKRGYDGSVLAAHTGSDIYAPRTLVVQRGALGTTAATHSLAAAVAVHAVPGLVRQLTIGEALNDLLQQGSGYARTVGSGDNEREAGGRGLRELRAAAMDAHGRTIRKGAI